jgi:hypothetical protein
VLNTHIPGSPYLIIGSNYFVPGCCFIVKDPCRFSRALLGGNTGDNSRRLDAVYKKTNPSHHSTLHGRYDNDTDDPQRTNTDEYRNENPRILIEPRDPSLAQ